jgi:hypothetical protein
VTGVAEAGLSVCCLTADPPAQVAASLSLLRDVADEIVVAVDSRVDPSELAPLAAVADTVVRFEFVDPPELARPWLVDLCQRPWVLMIDGDEVPSGDLIGALRGLSADDSAVQCRLARRWCWPDVGHWLAERPWWPDLQTRLFRPGASPQFDTRVHGGVQAAVPARIATESLYHLACVQATFAERRAKARRYERLRPGRQAVGGGPMNDTLYVPEHFATLRPADTPPDDVARLRTVLDAAASAPTGPGLRLPVVSAGEIADHVPAPALDAQGYRATLRIVEIDCRAVPGQDTAVLVEVRNDGDAPLPHRDRAEVFVRMGTRVLDPGTGGVVVDGLRSRLPGDVPPGQSRIVEALVRAPDTEGRYDVEFDLVNEGVRWFGRPVRAPLVVADRWARFRLG